jgi:hypothetical protein
MIFKNGAATSFPLLLFSYCVIAYINVSTLLKDAQLAVQLLTRLSIPRPDHRVLVTPQVYRWHGAFIQEKQTRFVYTPKHKVAFCTRRLIPSIYLICKLLNLYF